MATDPFGRIWLEPGGLWLSLKGNRVALYDGKTSDAFGDYLAVTRELKLANAARLVAERRARELEEQLKRKS
jgi:hypothetical protein